MHQIAVLNAECLDKFHRREAEKKCAINWKSKLIQFRETGQGQDSLEGQRGQVEDFAKQNKFQEKQQEFLYESGIVSKDWQTQRKGSAASDYKYLGSPEDKLILDGIW